MGIEGWGTYRLAELGELNRGKSKHRPRDAKHLYGGPYPFLQTGDIKAADGLVTTHTQTYSEAGLAQSRLWPKGTVAITIAANIAETAILGFDACFPDSVVGFIADEERTSGRFVEYLFRRLKRQIQHEHVGSGSVQDNINLGILNQLEFGVPPLPEQAQILRILGSLDDKIEMNRRMNETLEEMARALFRDWFVDFGPTRRQMEGATDPVAIMGHAFPPKKATTLAPLFPAKLGDDGLPQGYRHGLIGDLCARIFSGGTPKTTETKYWGGKLPWLSSGETRDSFLLTTEKMITQSGVDSSSTRQANKGSTVIASAGQGKTRGQTSFLAFDSYINQSVVALEADSNVLPASVLYLDLERRYEEFRSVSDAHSSRGSLTTKLLAGLPTVIAPKDMFALLGSVVDPIFEKIIANKKENQTLAEMRDLLLPKLMSGEIRLKDVETVA